MCVKMPLMMYECDYCEKQFRDTPAARKRHLQGVAHQRAKALWYDSLRYQAQIPNQHFFPQNGICNHFLKTGSCQYGDSCKYYHPKQDIQQLNARGGAGTNSMDSQINPTSRQVGLAPFGHIFGDQMGSSFGNLPPSLRPPPVGGYPPVAFIDWG